MFVATKPIQKLNPLMNPHVANPVYEINRFGLIKMTKAAPGFRDPVIAKPKEIKEVKTDGVVDKTAELFKGMSLGKK